MKVRILHYRSEFSSIMELLMVAINNYEQYEDTFIRIIVKDAKIIANERTYCDKVNRRVFLYSSELSKFDRRQLLSMDENNLQKTDYESILSFFKKR